MPSQSACALGDLAGQPDLRIALSHEFLGRADGWPALKRAYGLPQRPAGIDHGLAYEALAHGQIDATDIYSTDAKISKYHLRVLEDNQRVFPRYEAVIVYRLDVPMRHAAAWQALRRLAGTIGTQDMIAMNAAAEVDGKTFSAVARNFLSGHPGVSANGVARSDQRDNLAAMLTNAETGRLTARHLALVGGSVGPPRWSACRWVWWPRAGAGSVRCCWPWSACCRPSRHWRCWRC
jgi:osmoprotectant transport system permease protein